MMGLPAFGVRKPVVANLVMFAIIGAGLIFGIGLRREFFPEVDPTQVIIGAPYPGAAPDEVERALARESYTPVVVRYDDDTTRDAAEDDLRGRIDEAAHVVRVLSVHDVVPPDQQRRLEALRDLLEGLRELDDPPVFTSGAESAADGPAPTKNLRGPAKTEALAFSETEAVEAPTRPLTAVEPTVVVAPRSTPSWWTRRGACSSTGTRCARRPAGA